MEIALNELQNKTIRHKSKQVYLTKDIQNELINLIEKEAEQVLLTQHKQAKYFPVILDCTTDILHREQLTATNVLRFLQCDYESGVMVQEAFLGYLRVNDCTGKSC